MDSAHIVEVEDAPQTVRAPSSAPPPPPGRPAALDALAASLDVLASEHLPCEIDVVLDAGASSELYRDTDLAARLVSPWVTGMPSRPGLISVGSVRIGLRRVRIYERAEGFRDED